MIFRTRVAERWNTRRVAFARFGEDVCVTQGCTMDGALTSAAMGRTCLAAMSEKY